MAVRIGTAPRALLGALQAKIGGENPPNLGQEVTPTIDVYDQYLADQLDVELNETTTITGPATTALLTQTVPQNQTWRLLGLSISHSMNAADGALLSQISVAATRGAGNAQLMTGVLDGTGLTGAGSRTMALVMPRPLWLFPGWRLFWFWRLSAAPTSVSTASIAALIQRITE